MNSLAITKIPKLLLTLKEAALALGVSEWTVRREVTARRLACVRSRLNRGKIMILREDLAAYVQRNRVAAIGE